MDVITPQITIRQDPQRCGCFFECLIHFTRVLGVFTAIVLCGVGVDLIVHQHLVGIGIIISSAIVFWLEIVWAVTLFLQLCVRERASAPFTPSYGRPWTDRLIFWKCWDGMRWIDGWKKTILYGGMAVVPITWPCRLWLSYVAGGQLIALALFYFILSFKGKRRRRRKDHLLRLSDADSYESSRFGEVTEVLDDCLPEPIPGSSHSLSDTLNGDIETIVEI